MATSLTDEQKGRVLSVLNLESFHFLFISSLFREFK